ncbi:MAG: ribonuclease J [Oscillospiraceae bacterium]|jgi:ribonuclease J|nr:ribonuclease J [Oscillospiraceae bacterium]
MQEKLKIIPLGGVGEIGMNLTVFQLSGQILLVDCGISFPEEELFGVDLVIPDFSWLAKHKSDIVGLVITHGHEDHIGAVPYFLRDFQCPIYTTRLTAGLIDIKLEEHGLKDKAEIHIIRPGYSFVCGDFAVEFIRVNHSIADSVSLAITTKLGVIIHTGDFKIDTTPVDGEVIDLARFGELGKQGVRLLLSDSTNSDRPGFAMSERKVGETLDNLFRNSDCRVIITTFASNIHRLQQIIDASVKSGRKVAITGRSMENILRVAMELEYINIPPGVIVEVTQIKNMPKNRVCVITTGSQGEPMSALYRMAFGAHRQIEVGSGDRVILSASSIPGNELTITKVVNELLRRGCEVIYERLADIHVSGHACQEELKLMLALTKPEYFMPLHGDFKMLKIHAGLAKVCGVDPNKCFLPEPGRILELSRHNARLSNTVPTGRVFIDGSSIGEVGAVVLRDRKLLAEDGLIALAFTISYNHSEIVAGPEISARGFMFDKDADTFINELSRASSDCLEAILDEGAADLASIKARLKNELGEYIYKKTRRKPLLLPILLEC